MSDLFDAIVPVEGASLKAGKAYHDVPGVDAPAYRGGSQERAEWIADYIDLSGRRGLDIGCSVGGVSKALTDLGARMTGVDWDREAINVARGLIDTAKVVDLSRGWGVFAQLVASGEYDFAIWLSQWMWLAKQAGDGEARRRLGEISKLVPVLVFETAQSPDRSQAGSGGIHSAADVRAMLAKHTVYESIVDIGNVDGWEGGRRMFVCRRNVPVIRGEVAPGFGAATRDVSRGVYDVVSESLFPGTLNLQSLDLPEECREWNEHGPKALGPPVAEVVYSGIRRNLWPVHIRAGGNEATGWAMVPRGYGTSEFGTSIELLAEVGLRDKLAIEDGNALEIAPHRKAGQ